MKKILMWSALGLASSGAAHAQSTVTVFGVMDLGIQYTNGDGGGSVKALSNGGLSTSRLGFRGTEDLGGGLRAGFWLEGSLNPDTGTGRASNSNNQTSGAGVAGPITFDRMSFVSLSHQKMGELRLGRDFIPTHYNSIYFDPFNANGVARAGNLTFAGAGTGPLPTGHHGQQHGELLAAGRARRLLRHGDDRHGRERFHRARTATTATLPVRASALPRAHSTSPPP